LWGSSAGGHLAALAGDGVLEPERQEHGEFSTRVAAVVEGYGPMDFLQIDAQRPKPGTFTEHPEAAQLPKGPPAAAPDSPESRLIGAPIETRRDLARAASPLAYVRSGAPPFLILHGRSDSLVPMGQSELLFDALAATGNEATLLLIAGIGHAFLGRKDGWGDGRATTLRHTAGGKTDDDRAGPTASYALIETFFRQHLVR
jgi:acetyl esterase/lipase